MDQTVNALTIDVEDYFQAFKMRKINVNDDNKTYLDQGMIRILNILKKQGVKATFFINGKYAEKSKDIVKQISDHGHELGTHSYTHRKIHELSPAEFSDEIRKSKEIIEEIIGKKVLGFRAPAFSFDEKNSIYSKVLMDYEFKYDSSTNPIIKTLHGHPGYIPSFHKVSWEGRSFIEFPLATLPIMGKRLPWAGGFYFRLLPYLIFRKGLQYINKKNGSAVIYLHNWELDPKQPRIQCKPLLRFIHYYGLSNTEKKFKRLVEDFKFIPLQEFL